MYLQIVDNQKIYIKEDDFATVLYFDSLDNFALDNGSPAPTLTDGCKNMGYLQGEYCRGSDGITDVIYDIPWAEGEAIIDNLSVLLAAQEARQPEPEE